jgi:Raf kinase inhibitor-like YbhB/YbcL family protein
VDAVAYVGAVPIPKASYEHWVAVEKAFGSGKTADHRALGFLITSEWALGEAAAQHVSVSEVEVRERLAQLEKESFSEPGSLAKYLSQSGQTEADLLARMKVELLTSRTAAKLTAGKSAAQRKSTLASFQQAFQRRWRSRTTCKTGYVMENCSEYHGKPENLTATSSSSARSGSSASASSVSGSSAGGSSSGSSSAGGEAGLSLGFAISSPAFEDKGAIPARYTCDGANITPPLQWRNVPAKAKALVLIIIDDAETGPARGIRWMVANISPTSKGVAAGQVPAGGVVGVDTQGHSGYGGICPEHGKTDTIEFVLYALSKPIPVSAGFEPNVAEHDYGAGGLLLSSGAVTYGVYHRP